MTKTRSITPYQENQNRFYMGERWLHKIVAARQLTRYRDKKYPRQDK